MTLERLPPVVQILLAESPSEADKRDPTKYIRRLLPELRRQAEWTMKHGDDYYLGTEERPDGLVIDPASGLDPFSTHGKCGEAACRLHNADLVARTVGLYADCAIVGDHFTDHVLLSERWSHYDNYLLFSNLLVLRRLKPMLEAGVFRFTSNFGAYCRRHSEEFKAKVKVAADEAVKLSASGLHLVVRADRVEVHTSEPLGSPLVFTAPMTKKLKKKVEKAHDLKKLTVELFAPVIYDEVHETLFKMRRATPFRAVTFSNSRVSLRAARHFDAESPSAAETEIWEASRSANLPWVSDLTPTQILELREGAHRALPRFRERMGRGLTGGSREEAAKVIRDLREEAAEVEAELRALDARGESRFRNLSGILGMTVSVYGFAGEFLAAGAALTGLGTLLGLLHAAGHKERQSLEKLVARPGYVLVKAKELTEHAPAP
jgi:hypothetical protein